MQKTDLTVLKTTSFHTFNLFNLTFIEAEATNTRYMGVVALRALYKDFQGNEFLAFFHLDFEDYGIDGYHVFCMKSPEGHYQETGPEEAEKIFDSLAGGLGGTLVALGEKDLQWLVYSAYTIDKEAIECFVDLEGYGKIFEAIGDNFKEEMTQKEALEGPREKGLSPFQRDLYNRLSPKIQGVYTLMHYAVMRLVGRDYLTARMFFKKEVFPFTLCQAPYTLLKSEISPLEGPFNYGVKALIDFEDKYKIITLALRVEGLQIQEGLIKEVMEISSIEAGFALKKKEYMKVYQMNNELFERRFFSAYTRLMKTEFDKGTLYTAYNKDNGHVDERVYYLNGDLYGLYYFTCKGQVVLASFDEDHLEVMEKAIKAFDGESDVQYYCDLVAEEPVLYSFINSPYDNIFEFLEDEVEQ